MTGTHFFLTGIGPSTENTKDGDSPLVNQLDDNIMAGFPTGRPLQDKPDLVQCKHCKKPVLKVAAAAHIKECLSKKQEKLKKKKEAKEAKDAAARKEKGEKGGDDDDEPSSQAKGARKSAIKGANEEGKKGKKRKADTDAGKEPKSKKKKDEPKAKPVKQKGPVDVERQCGVSLPNGGQCARSLTCKSHSMGLKRAVPGRSLPYDILLAQYQKKNQAKQQSESPFLFSSYSFCLQSCKFLGKRLREASIRPNPTINSHTATDRPSEFHADTGQRRRRQ